MIRNSLAAGAALVLLAGCASFDPHAAPPPSRSGLHSTPVAPVIGLALGGGGPRGFAHIGVIQALQELGINPSVVAGTSVGALVGSLYAAGYDGAQLRRIAQDVGPLDVFDFTLAASGGYIAGKRLQKLVDTMAGVPDIALLPRRFAAVATDRADRTATVFDSGPVGRAVNASSAVPGSFVPVVVNGRSYIDGDRSSPVPVAAARRLGADIVIAVDLFPDEYAPETESSSPAWRAYTRERRQRMAAELAGADIHIRPQLERKMQIGRRYYDANALAGYTTVYAMRAQICAVVTCGVAQ